MVAGVVLDMGWPQFLLHAHLGPTTRLPSVFRCSWHVGLWAIWNSQWFYSAWSAAQSPLSIAYKELFLIVVAAALRGHWWVTQGVPERQRGCGGCPPVGYLPGPAVNVVAP